MSPDISTANAVTPRPARYGSFNRVTVTYDDFSGGEYADMPIRQIPHNAWTGVNMRLNLFGRLAPRPGLKKVDLSGMPTGTVQGFGYVGEPTHKLLLVVGDTIYSSDADQDVIVLTANGTLSAPATEWCNFAVVDPNDKIYLTNPGENTYEVDWPGGVASPFTVDGVNRGFRTIYLHGPRLYLAGDVTAPAATNPGYRIYYSQAGAFTNFVAPDGGNFDPPGYLWEIYSLIALGNHLYIPQRRLGWWALIGGSPETGTVRRVRAGDPPGIDASSKQQEVVGTPDRVWFRRNGGRLAYTDGSNFDVDTYNHLKLVGDHAWGVYLDQIKHVVYGLDVGSTFWSWCWNKCWTRHQAAVDLSGPVSNTEFDNRVVFVGGDGPGQTGKLYQLDLSLQRPGFDSDQLAEAGTDDGVVFDTSVGFPYEWDPEGRDVCVRGVSVEFVKYDTGSADNSFDLEVQTYARIGSDNYDSNTDHTWAESNAGATAQGTYDKVTFNTKQVWGGAFRIVLSNIRGIEIERVQAFVEVQEGRNQMGAP